MTTESWSVAAPQTIEVADTTSLTVRLTNGRAEIVADPDRSSGAAIEVLEVSSRPLQVLAEHGTLRVAYDFPGIEGFVDRFRGLRDQDSAVVRITVPATAAVDVATVGAEAVVTGSRSRVNVKSVTGAVAVTGTSGALSVKSVSGPIVVTEHTGDVTVNQASGPATVSGGLGRVTVNGVSGPVDVASSGTTPMVSAKTVAGAVTITLDAGTPVNLRARSVTGKVTLDGEPLASTAQRTVVVDHPEPGATCYLSTNTVSGATTILRA
ncbi:hypothetical protein [Myceligenerans pegani]|uniref:Adhesin domain-containing protein n=1 Tax=Myceligenerans pegani TaxID=2776917 RepID=A0ABR9MXR9_9MICO|nr:hypothetical protein [Myceligenerans sp. TRM 65318]MBE1876181.1 hypothetical protein [Myceligenerans sp. TRM 65318]MBE3018452.1 hypothetical protein [Myceligenerans sp. TRM 65318]